MLQLGAPCRQGRCTCLLGGRRLLGAPGTRRDALELPPEAIVPSGLSQGGPAARALAPAGARLSLE